MNLEDWWMSDGQKFVNRRIKEFGKQQRRRALLIGAVIALSIAVTFYEPVMQIGGIWAFAIGASIAGFVTIFVVVYSSAMNLYDTLDFIQRLNEEAEAAKRISNKD
jgi:predicted tellurium resistance membrane protein TerC